MTSLSTGLLGLGIGLMLLVGGIFSLRRKKLMDDLPTSKARSASVGLVEMKGKAIINEEHVSSITGKKGVYLRYFIHEKSVGKEWQCIEEDENAPDFYLQDRSGRILVRQKGAEYNLEEEEFSSGLFHKDSKLIRLLDRLKIEHKGLLGEKRYKYMEYFIPEGKQLYVQGYARKGVLAKGEGKLIVSAKSENEISNDLKIASWAGIVIGAMITIFYIGYIVYAAGIR